MSAGVPDVAAIIEQGARYTQQDAVRVEAHGDGSWMLAVADGGQMAAVLGLHFQGDSNVALVWDSR